MTLLHIFVVAVVQGITEFLPISSQAHLILLPRLSGLCDQGLIIDIAVHVGTLGAVMLYFWRDMWGMGKGVAKLARGRVTPEGRLFGLIVLSTLPVAAVGYLVKTYVGYGFRNIEVIAWATLLFAVLLWIADRWGVRVRRVEHMTWDGALIIGCAQVLALVPGTSRSGITMTAARWMGFERADAARFSMLMAIPVILGAGTLAGIDVAAAGNAQFSHAVIWAVAFAFVSALAAIAVLMSWLKRASFAPFIIYRLVLGVALLVAIYLYGVTDASLSRACIP